MNLRLQIQQLATSTKLTNPEIARILGCSERSVRRYAGPWEERIKKNRLPQEFTGGVRKAFLLYDVHIPYHDVSAYRTAIEYGKQWMPDDVIIGGDYADFRAISYWKDDPDRPEFNEEVEMTQEFLQELRESFPSARMIYIVGNHEARLEKFLWQKAPELYRLPSLSVPKLLGLRDLEISYVSNVNRMIAGDTPFQIGKLFVLHGHEIKMSWDGVNLARTMFLKTFNNTISGHFHQRQEYIGKNLNGHHGGAWLVGGLCRLSESYSPMNNWVHGFATVKYDVSTGLFKVRNKIILGDRVL